MQLVTSHLLSIHGKCFFFLVLQCLNLYDGILNHSMTIIITKHQSSNMSFVLLRESL